MINILSKDVTLWKTIPRNWRKSAMQSIALICKVCDDQVPTHAHFHAVPSKTSFSVMPNQASNVTRTAKLWHKKNCRIMTHVACLKIRDEVQSQNFRPAIAQSTLALCFRVEKSRQTLFRFFYNQSTPAFSNIFDSYYDLEIIHIRIFSHKFNFILVSNRLFAFIYYLFVPQK